MEEYLYFYTLTMTTWQMKVEKTPFVIMMILRSKAKCQIQDFHDEIYTAVMKEIKHK